MELKYECCGRLFFLSYYLLIVLNGIEICDIGDDKLEALFF